METQKPLFFGVIAVIMERSLKGLIAALYKAGDADSLEIRLDEFRAHNSPEELRVLLIELAKRIGKRPTILTLGSIERGAAVEIPFEEQLRFWQQLPPELASMICDKDSQVFVDWDTAFIHLMSRQSEVSPFPWEKVGASVHYMKETPPDLLKILLSLQKAPAKAFLKLVAFAKKPEDCSRIWQLFHKRHGDKRPLIAFAIGEHGTDGRSRCLLFGSAGTYAFVDGRQKAAPGQLPLSTLLALVHRQRTFA